jgi:hypothetical protein
MTLSFAWCASEASAQQLVSGRSHPAEKVGRITAAEFRATLKIIMPNRGVLTLCCKYIFRLLPRLDIASTICHCIALIR